MLTFSTLVLEAPEVALDGGFVLGNPLLNRALLLGCVLLPLALGLFLLVAGFLRDGVARALSTLGFVLPAAGAIWLWLAYTSAAPAGTYLFNLDLPTGLQDFGISLKLGLNGISAPLFLLTGIVSVAAGLFSLSTRVERHRVFLGLLLFMTGGLYGLFASRDILFFYLFHEFALIPTFIMIGIWGGQGRRTAAFEMTIYLTLGAMLSLTGLIAIYAQSGLSSFDIVSLRTWLFENGLSEVWQKNLFALLLIGFGILVSLFPFHTWAPRGYAAAPTAVAMLHAGVLKKFGLYGLIQIGIPLLPLGAGHWSGLLVWLALGNVLILGLVTLAQRDLRLMLGYGSVMHMGYAFLGIATLSTTGIGGAVMLVFAHGLSIALLFLLADAVERRTGTTDLFAMGGLAAQAPVLAACFVAAMMASIGLPGFANFWAELTVFAAAFQMHKGFGAAVVLGVIISAIYGLRAVARIFFGPATPNLAARKERIQDLSPSELSCALLLLSGLLLTGLLPVTITLNIHQAVLALEPVLEEAAQVARWVSQP